MRSAFEISAKEVMNTDPVTASTEESVSQIKNRMEENKLRAIPVLDENQDFAGVISYRELVRFVQFNPEITAPGKLMHQPPKFEAGDNLVEIADLRINSGRKMMVALSNGKLSGVIGDHEFLDILHEVEELGDVSTGRLASRELVTVEENELLEKARHAMLDNNISRLPVLDDGEVTGLIDSVDILRMMVKRDRQPSGGTSGNREGDKVYIAGGREREDMSQVTVDQLMQEQVYTSKEHMPAREAVENMRQKDVDYIVFVENGYPEAIITLKDVVDHLAELARQQTILVQLTGLDVAEEKAAIHQKIRNQVQGSLGRKLEKPREISLRIKKAEKDGKKHRYEIDLKLFSEYGVTAVNEEGWELLDIVDEALGELNRIIREEHDRKTDHR